MARVFYFGLISCFWLAMNVLLWRAEFGGQSEFGGTVPVELVWERILTAPDDSAMEITRNGRQIGYCRWRAHILEGVESDNGNEATAQPEGQVRRVTGYAIDLEGSAAIPEAGHVRFSFRGEFDPKNAWKVLKLRASMRPLSWEVRAVAAEDTVHVTGDDGEQTWNRAFRLSDLRDPARLLQETGLAPGLLLGGLQALPPEGAGLPPNLIGFRWEAHQDWLRIGRTRVRAYRLQGRFLEQYRATILVSRVGELLRAELPGQIHLVNESLPDFELQAQ